MCILTETNKCAVFFDKIAPHWDEMCTYSVPKLNRFMRLMNITEGEDVLDVGCGTGVLIPFFRQYNTSGHIHAVDISFNMIEKAKEKFGQQKNIHFSVSDIEKDEVKGLYQAIFLYSVYPHLNDGITTVERLVRKNLKPGGKLIIAHSDGREILNQMHRRKDPAVCDDILPPIELLAAQFRDLGITVCDSYEDEDIYYALLANPEKNR